MIVELSRITFKFEPSKLRVSVSWEKETVTIFQPNTVFKITESRLSYLLPRVKRVNDIAYNRIWFLLFTSISTLAGIKKFTPGCLLWFNKINRPTNKIKCDVIQNKIKIIYCCSTITIVWQYYSIHIVIYATVQIYSVIGECLLSWNTLLKCH